MYTPLELDKVRNLRYGMKAISILEKKLNKSMSKIDFENMSMEEMATIIWAGLIHEDKDLTVDGVMDLVDEYGDLNKVMESVGKAFNDAFGSKKKEKN